ncbi:SDR family NAD(P)-dependent oxidoreductase [Knoellia sp. LjRoot47]|uniref:SDR family NAD(P)-dependent oxidoreductase n=1 Tax=Knoellia sp. LjRoot47 TaxID=3342330 RepID=UPI003ECCCF45
MSRVEPSAAGSALVTGASSGIGLATALALSRGGWTVVLVGRDTGSLERAAQACRRAGGTAVVAVADVRDTASVRAAFELADDETGSLDVVVHSAATLAYGRFEDVPDEVFESALDTTLMGTTRVCREALSRFRLAGRGRLVVIGSLLGKTAVPGMSTYTTAKWGVHGLVRSLQLETRDEPGIQVSLVSPGGVDTPVYRQAGTYLGRHGQPPPPRVDAFAVADAVMGCLDRPRREVNVGAGNALTVMGFRAMPAIYDRLVGPLMNRVALQAGSGVADTPGNVLEPRPEAEALSGGWLASTTGARRALDMEENTMDDTDQHLTTQGQPQRRTVAASADRVWDVLADGWSYATWVVGTARIRDVDTAWPAPGSRIHHSVGLWPALLSDTTSVEECVTGRRLVLKARGWPLGEARVEIDIEPDGPQSCTVTMTEDAISGPGSLPPRIVRQAMILPRNSEALRRLAYLAKGSSGLVAGSG